MMNTSAPPEIQRGLEETILRLVSEFVGAPYRFFTEADAVARFHQLLDESSVFNELSTTNDGQEIGLIHREYPTFFRFADKNPTERLGPPARRGHYDTVILNPEYIRAHSAETVANRTIGLPRDEKIMPLKAVVEFKLDNKGWSRGRTTGVINELGKLNLSFQESPLCYLVVLMRYFSPSLRRWEKYWPKVQQEAIKHTKIKSIFAINWLQPAKNHEVFQFNNWVLS